MIRQKILQAFVNAIRGIIVAVREQRNLKIQVTAACIVIVMGIYFPITTVEWCLLVLSIGLVLAAEIINSSIENIVDLITQERNPLAGKIKDMAAGAVLLISIMAAIIGIIIFEKYLVN